MFMIGSLSSVMPYLLMVTVYLVMLFTGIGQTTQDALEPNVEQSTSDLEVSAESISAEYKADASEIQLSVVCHKYKTPSDVPNSYFDYGTLLLLDKHKYTLFSRPPPCC